ncbi:MAG TPA: hypothetical protein V6D18_08795 [Thermosynechococcaceae cyanobacterium]
MQKQDWTEQHSRWLIRSGLICTLDRRETLTLDILRYHAGFASLWFVST